jgi:DNA-binding SARP family transcriptional activator
MANAETLVRLSPDTASRWLERLPAAARSDPRAHALHGQLEASRGRHGAAVEPLRSAIASLAEPHERATLEAILVDTLYWLGRLEEARDVVANAAVRTPLILFWDVYLLATVGRIEEAEALIPAATHASTAGRLDVAFFLVAMPDGRHEEAIARLQERYRALPREERTGHWPQHVASFTAFALADAGRPEEALDWIERAHEEMTRAGLAEAIEPLMHIHRGWTLVLAGREAEAELALGAMPGSEPPEGWTPVILLATLAACAAARTDHARARTLADQALVLSASAPVQFRAMVGWVLVPVMAEASGTKAAHALLDAIDTWLDERLPPPHGGYFRLRAAALRAWTHFGGGDRAAAAVTIERLLQDPAPASVEMVVRAEWRRVEPVLRAGVAEGRLPPERALALLAGGSEAGMELERTVREAGASVRGAAARVIGRSGHPRAGALLRDLARDPDPEVAGAAEAALAAGVAAPPPRSFRLFGGFVFGRGRWTADESAWRRPTSARLVRVLLLRRGSLVPEDELLEALWPGSGSKAARTSLQVAASRARTVLDVPDAPLSAIQNQERAYRIVLDPQDRVDTEVFAIAARDALAAPGPERTGRLERAAGLWTAEPLPEDRYADWTREWREGLETTYGRVMRALAEARAREADHAGAAAAAGFLVERDPLDEGMQRLLIASHARAGNRSRALRQYLACRRSLVDALGIEPAAETQELQRRVLAGASV